jgi:hypothetical protein
MKLCSTVSTNTTGFPLPPPQIPPHKNKTTGFLKSRVGISHFFSLNDNTTCEWLRYRWEVRDQRLYGPELVSKYFLLFESLKRNFTRMRFATDADVKQAVTFWLTDT